MFVCCVQIEVSGRELAVVQRRVVGSIRSAEGPEDRWTTTRRAEDTVKIKTASFSRFCSASACGGLPRSQLELRRYVRHGTSWRHGQEHRVEP